MAEIPNEIYEAFRLMKEKDYAGAESLLQKGAATLDEADPAQAETGALYHSTLGVLDRLQGKTKEAWRHYEKAEKFLPDDPSLKIILAKFLIEEFAQYDGAIKKMREVLKMAKGVPSFEHQAHAILAIALLRKGERKKAVEMFQAAMEGDFQKIVTSQNINLDLIAAFTARNAELALCRDYLTKALALAQLRKEPPMTELFQKLLNAI